MSADLECPYCGKDIEICHDDGFGYEESIKHQYECEHCGKNFVFQTSICFYYEAEKADCLNDDKHDYQLTHTFPQAFSKMECSMCGHTRELTEEERQKFEIESKEDYCKIIKNQK